MSLRSWGRLEEYEVQTRTLSDIEEAENTFCAEPALPHGAGRSYGDVAIASNVWLTKGLSRFKSFDDTSGELRVESGVTLGEIQQIFAPRGWLLPVTPGTQFVTVGGAIANDVHGKNHHQAGTFGAHVKSFQLVRSDGSYQCSKTKNPKLFAATIGGLGLTGLITEATITLKKVNGPWIDAEVIPFSNLSEFFKLAEESHEFEYTVAWFDCTSKSGRGLFTRGNHSTSAKPANPSRKLRFALTPPISLINGFTLPLLNLAYYALGRISAGKKTVHYQPFFYPLDGIQEWNRAYGPKGFYQHQSVLPKSSARAGLEELLEAIREAKAGSLLAVLKTTGNRKPPGLLTFPIEGVTLALDFPNNGDATRSLLKRLDEITISYGGRVNPSKDATMSRSTFAASFDQINEFLKSKDPKITSKFFERVMEKK